MTAQDLITDFTENYLAKLFYFCLRKTGSEYEAEDLSQEIAVAVITSLRKGNIPDNFPAWMWRISNNHYCDWVKKTNNHGHADFEETEDFISDDFSLEESVLLEEDIKLLRRELAFISDEFRSILVAYYIKDKTVKTIANELSLPEGTVKYKLFRARNILKEGIEMAREFGEKSYNPANIVYTMSGAEGTDGTPFSLVNNLMVQNIMVCAYRNPVTAEEIALEIGVALPFVEDTLEKMVNATVLRKEGQKYSSTVYIVSKEVYETRLKCISENIEQFTDKVIEFIETSNCFHKENNCQWNEGYQDEADYRWALLMEISDYFGHAADTDRFLLDAPKTYSYTQRPNGGCWELLGYEDYESRYKVSEFVGMNGCFDVNGEHDRPDRPRFWQYKYNIFGISNQTPAFVTVSDGKVLEKIVKGESIIGEDSAIDRLISYGYVKKENEKYIPTFLVQDKSKKIPFTPLQQQILDDIKNSAVKILDNINETFWEAALADAPKHLIKNDAHSVNFVIESICQCGLRGDVLEEALRRGYITYENKPNEAKDRALGARMSIN